MNDLIEALTIFLKYMEDEPYPTQCSHDTLTLVCPVNPKEMKKKHRHRLKELGFFWSKEYETWMSFRFGSC